MAGFNVFIGELLGDVLAGVFRVLVELVGSAVVEFLVRGPGYLVCRRFNGAVDADSLLVLFVGLAFWALVIFAGYVCFHHAGAAPSPAPAS